MPLVAAAILPHTPLLAPAVGRDHRKQLRRTVEASERIATELYALQANVIILLTPHGQVIDRSFFVNVAETFQLGLASFGDLSTTIIVRGHPALAYQLKRACERHHFPITLGTESSGDYGTTVPSIILQSLWPHASLLPISPSALSIREHVNFGQIVGNVAITSSDRVAVIASVELAHRSADTRAAESLYDTHMVQAIRRGDFGSLTAIDERTVSAAKTCSHSVLAMLRGVLGERDPQPSVLSYESPFGVGEVAALFPTL